MSDELRIKSKPMPKVSIMMVTYNQEAYIDEAIEGVVLQDYENLELIICDDGSSDKTQERIAVWQSRFPNRIIALLNAENVGVTKNCNRGLKACSGEFVVLFCGDDVMLPGKISAQVDWLMQDENRVLCGHSHDVIDQNGVFLRSLSAKNSGKGAVEYIKHCMQLEGITTMMRASSIPPHGVEERIKVTADYILCIEVLANGGEYGFIDGVYVKYRDAPNSVTKKYMDIVNDYGLTYKIIAERYPQFSKYCKDSLFKHVVYFGGVLHLKFGNKPAARERFLEAIKQRPYYLKAWIRLLQTI